MARCPRRQWPVRRQDARVKGETRNCLEMKSQKEGRQSCNKVGFPSNHHRMTWESGKHSDMMLWGCMAELCPNAG